MRRSYRGSLHKGYIILTWYVLFRIAGVLGLTAQTFDDLSTIANDIDATTSMPYSPLPVLQAAHWSAADLKSRILSHERSGGSIPTEESFELGLTQSSSEIASVLASRRRLTPRSRATSSSTTSSQYHISTASLMSSVTAFVETRNRYYPVPSDDTHRIGAGGLLLLPTPSNPHGISGLPDFGPVDYSTDPSLTSTSPATT